MYHDIILSYVGLHTNEVYIILGAIIFSYLGNGGKSVCVIFHNRPVPLILFNIQASKVGNVMTMGCKNTYTTKILKAVIVTIV